APDADAAPREAQAHLQAAPRRRQARVEPERRARRAGAEETVDERLPDAAHAGEVEACGRRLREVVEVDAGGEAQRLERLPLHARPGEERGVDRRRERAAVRRARLVEAQVRLERR